MKTTKEIISDFIKNRRKELDLTQDEVAKVAKISKATLWKLESSPNEVNINFDNLEKILNALHSSFFDVFNSSLKHNTDISLEIDGLQTSDSNKNLLKNLISKEI